MFAIVPSLAQYLYVLATQTTVLVYPSAAYPKSLHLNSFCLPTANGYQRLTIPLKGGRTCMRSLADTEIIYCEPWLNLHRKALDTCYKNSPWYAWYIDDFWNIYAQKHRFLLDKIIAVYQYLGKTLEREQEIVFAYQLRIPRLNYSEIVPEYPQVFAEKFGFLPKVSLLDLLFHLGTEAKNYVKCVGTN